MPVYIYLYESQPHTKEIKERKKFSVSFNIDSLTAMHLVHQFIIIPSHKKMLSWFPPNSFTAHRT